MKTARHNVLESDIFMLLLLSSHLSRSQTLLIYCNESHIKAVHPYI